MTTDRELTLTRIFDAPRELVFRAWTDPELFVSWIGPAGCTGDTADFDVVPGGAWRATMLDQDGGEHGMYGRYTEIAEPERLAFTFVWDVAEALLDQSQVTLTFADLGGKTEMTFHQTGFGSTAQRDDHGIGWTEAFDKIGPLLARSIR
ncbi:SRPBCC family protein [Amycolatopsis minnesotensis]